MEVTAGGELPVNASYKACTSTSWKLVCCCSSFRPSGVCCGSTARSQKWTGKKMRKTLSGWSFSQVEETADLLTRFCDGWCLTSHDGSYLILQYRVALIPLWSAIFPGGLAEENNKFVPKTMWPNESWTVVSWFSTDAPGALTGECARSAKGRFWKQFGAKRTLEFVPRKWSSTLWSADLVEFSFGKNSLGTVRKKAQSIWV